MRVIKIDPVAQTVTEDDIDVNLRTIQDYVGGYFEAHPLKTGDFLYLNEEGLLSSATPFDHYFAHSFSHQAMFAGRALLVGPPDEEGNETPTKAVLSDVRKSVSFAVPDHLAPKGKKVDASAGFNIVLPRDN